MTVAYAESIPNDLQQEEVRRAVRSWLEANWDPRSTLREWRVHLADSGWAVPSWPTRWYGQSLPTWADHLVAEEIAAIGAAGPPLGSGMGLAAPTILAHGSDSIRERFLRPILIGDEKWCQLFSEPGAGSDLAGLTTRADRDGDHWVVNGQKVWNTNAHRADYGMLLARTNWEVPKHRGITFLGLPMHQSGVEVRPLRQMNDYSSFNEVYMADAVIPVDHIIGEVDGGWAVATATLTFERRMGAVKRPAYQEGSGRAILEAEQEADEYFETYKWYPQRFGRVDLEIDHARSSGRDGDGVVRQAIAKVLSTQRIMDWTSERSEAARARGGTGIDGSIKKLMLSEVSREAARVHSLIAGASGMLSGEIGPYEGAICEIVLSVPAQSIAGGTDEIQKNILGERVLGLPREPVPDKDAPFRDVKRN